MKKFSFLFLFGFLFISGFMVHPAHADTYTYVSGSISSNTTWASNSRYIIQGSLTIDSGAKLTIQDGTVVKFDSQTAYLQVNGQLQVNGSSSNKVFFTSLKDDWIGGDAGGDGTTTPLAGDWCNIKLGSNASSTLSWAVVRYGGYTGNPCYSNTNIYNNGGVLTFSNSHSTNATSYGIFNYLNSTSTIVSADLSTTVVLQ